MILLLKANNNAVLVKIKGKITQEVAEKRTEGIVRQLSEVKPGEKEQEQIRRIVNNMFPDFQFELWISDIISGLLVDNNLLEALKG